MTEVQDTREQMNWRVSRTSGVVTAVSLVVMSCWTVLVGGAGICVWMGGLWSVANMLDEQIAQRTMDQCTATMLGGLALAVAPWIVGGIVLGVRWWRSRTPTPSRDIE